MTRIIIKSLCVLMCGLICISNIACDENNKNKQENNSKKIHLKDKQIVDAALKDTVIELEPIVVEAPHMTREELIAPLKKTIEKLVENQIPFDEPRTEVGQEDGILRPLWEKAWRKGANSYDHKGDKYWVFSSKGYPIPPQVCADFIIDTFDISKGSWYRSYYKKRWRDHVNWNLHDSIRDKGYNPRRLIELIEYFEETPDLFSELYRDDGHNHTMLSNQKESKLLFKELDLQVGDIIFIRGMTPWDTKNEHWHSFIVYHYNVGKDNWQVAGNPVMATVRWITTEGQRTPKRYIEGIWRPTDKLLRL